jgi:hypothetical protein
MEKLKGQRAPQIKIAVRLARMTVQNSIHFRNAALVARQQCAARAHSLSFANVNAAFKIACHRLQMAK